MDAATITALGAVVVAIISGGFTYRASSKASSIDHRKVDAEAYDRATRLWEKNLEFSERQVRELREHVDRLEAELRRREDVEESLRRTVNRMRLTIQRLEYNNQLLRAQLRAAGIEIPEPPQESEADDPESDLGASRSA